MDRWDVRGAIRDRSKSTYIDLAEDDSVYGYDFNPDDPVIISFPFPRKEGMLQSVPTDQTSCCSITIENTTSDPIELWGVKIYCSNPADSFTLSLKEPPSANSTSKKVQGFSEDYVLEDRVLQPHQKLTIWLSCKPKELGLHSTLLHFDVGDDRIERFVFLMVEDDISRSLAPTRSYARASRGRKQFPVDDAVPYIDKLKNSSKPRRKSKNMLPDFPIPKHIRNVLENKEIPECLIEGLKTDNYNLFFSTLLIMEELEIEKAMSNHSVEATSMKKKGTQYLALDMPGVAEKQPTLSARDDVYAKNSLDKSPDNPIYKGRICRVDADQVILTFPQEFLDSFAQGNLYDVQFGYNRSNMRRLYQAVEMVETIDREFVFPSRLQEKRVVENVQFTPFTGNLNMEQRDSVAMILGCKGPPPYVIYGPPGTGKTKTVVEAILQLYAKTETSRILVCAASNSAADHVLEKLISNENVKVKDNKIFRLNAVSRAYGDLHSDHIRFCYSVDGVFGCPPVKALKHYRIIISTYSSSLMLHAEGLNRGHFSHIFLDESGQASEPECMVPIGNFCVSDTVVVLAGDPKQLGPVVCSKDAQDFGLGKSFLDRLFECESYAKEDKDYVTKLVRNYRCHPAILDLPSKLFYDGELMACKQESLPFVSSCLNFIPNKEFPSVFVGVQGCEERQGNNPSWFNRIEVSKVVDIIRKLTDSGSVEEKDIGVISPYKQQVLKIKSAMENWGVEDVKVGSVEQYQGQEKEVIIITTVRSTLKPNELGSVGFLSNPRRFNVAITRAKSLLIIVGNPHVICQDEYWNKLLSYCVDNNSYHGNPLPERNSGAEEPDQYDTPELENDWV